MNIWIFQHYATPPDTPGGTRHYNFARDLMARGHQVTIFVSAFNHGSLRQERLDEGESYKREQIQGVDFILLKTSHYTKNDARRMANMLTYALRTVRYGMTLSPAPDVIWASNPHLFAGLAGYVLAKARSARFVFEVRDLWPQVFVDIGAFSPRNPMIMGLRNIEKFIYSKAERIITLMPRATDYIASLGISPGKVVHIPHGVNFEMFSDTSKGLPKDLAALIARLKDEGKMIIGYTGAHGAADALETVIQAASTLESENKKGIHFLMVGEGTERNRLVDSVSRMGLSNITFYPAIPKSNMPALLNSIDVGLICKKDSNLYKYGTSFIKTFDYMACSLPVLWAVRSGDSPVADSGCGIIIPPEDSAAMVEAAKAFLGMSVQKRGEMGKKGLDYVREHHDHNKLTDRLEKILKG
jgi:glycosyltransferase involved in cell wall biosynthesis